MQVTRLLSFFASAASQLHGRSIARSIRQSVEGNSNPPERWWGIPIPTTGLFYILTCAFALGQVAGPVPAPPVNLRPVPTFRLYYDFLMFVTHNDRKADQREKQNIDSEGMRNHQQKMLGFTDQELEDLLAEPEQVAAGNTDDDAVPETPGTAVTVPGAVWLRHDAPRRLPAARRTKIDAWFGFDRHNHRLQTLVWHQIPRHDRD